MVRAALPENEKRKQVAVRLSPRDRERIEALAAQTGNSLGAEVEQLALTQLAYLEGVHPKTQALLERILEKIVEMEEAAKGKWHKNLKAWAAVSQALQTILDEDRPERAFDDEFFRQALETTIRLTKARAELVAKLSRLGIAVNEDPRPNLLGEVRLRGLFGNGVALRNRSSRDWEQAAIDAMPEDITKKAARDLFAELRDLDSQIEAAREDEMEKFRPYYEAEEEGRRIGGKQSGLNALVNFVKGK